MTAVAIAAIGPRADPAWADPALVPLAGQAAHALKAAAGIAPVPNARADRHAVATAGVIAGRIVVSTGRDAMRRRRQFRCRRCRLHSLRKSTVSTFWPGRFG